MSAAPRRKIAEPDATRVDNPRAERTRATRTLDVVLGEAAGTLPTLDSVIHERARLAIVTALATGDARSHTELRELLQLTDGNLSVHARKLEEAGYVTRSQSDFDKRVTFVSLADAGVLAVGRYLEQY